MSLPASWVDRIFQRLTVVYGRDFLSRYDGQDIAEVKADWGAELTCYQQAPEAIRYALEHIPSDKPPTVLQFRDICRRAPQYVPPALPSPPPDPTMAQELRRVFKPMTGRGDRSWVAKLQARIDAKEIRPTKFQRDALAELKQEQEA